MSGMYPDVPSWRMAIDRDGTQAFYRYIEGNTQQRDLTPTQLTQMSSENGEAGFAGSAEPVWVTFIFPELRDVDAYLFNLYAGGSGRMYGPIEVSSNTTNGIDGTWTLLRAGNTTIGTGVMVENGIPVGPSYRTAIQSGTVLNCKAIRIFADSSVGAAGVRNAWFFGEPAPGQNLKRVEIWHPTLDERVGPAYFDWGDVARSSTADRPFRVKNMHSTLTAQSVRVAMSILTDSLSPSVVGQFLISQGGSYAAQQTIGDVAPGAVSGTLTLRRVTPSNAILSLWTHRLHAEPQGWV